MEDVYSADVAYCQVSHRYKKGVSETKTPQDQISIHCNNALNQFSLLPLPHPQPPSQTPCWQCHKVLSGLPTLQSSSPPTLCSEPFIFSYLIHCSSQLWQHNGESLQTTDVWAPPQIVRFNHYSMHVAGVIPICSQSWEPLTCKVLPTDSPLHKPSHLHDGLCK